MKPSTVPIMKELAGAARRKTHLQHRGNFLDVGEEIKEGVPAVFLRRYAATPQPPRPREMAGVAGESADCPSTWPIATGSNSSASASCARARSSASRASCRSHPELLDWLATELVRLKWDMKAFVKLLVTSATYRQSSEGHEGTH